MKKGTTLLVLFILTCLTIVCIDVAGFSYGAPDGNTGSPGDAQTCTVCHVGAPASYLADLITSTIPAAGYLGDSTYTITAKVVRSGHATFGFQISPQYINGNLAGSLIETDPTTQVTGLGTYITHAPGGTSGSDSLSWTFDWQAPPAGSGPITFYGAFNIANGDGFNSFDTIVNSSLVVQEDVTLKSANSSIENTIYIYPNPASERITINGINEAGNSVIRIYSSTGKLIRTLDAIEIKNQPISLDLTFVEQAGLYYFQILNGSRQHTIPILIQPRP